MHPVTQSRPSVNGEHALWCNQHVLDSSRDILIAYTLVKKSVDSVKLIASKSHRKEIEATLSSGVKSQLERAGVGFHRHIPKT